MGLKTGIWASRLEFGPRDWDLRGGDVEGEGGEGEGEMGKILISMCETASSVQTVLEHIKHRLGPVKLY